MQTISYHKPGEKESELNLKKFEKIISCDNNIGNLLKNISCMDIFGTIEKQVTVRRTQSNFGCEDSYICFTSKYYADRHELEHHPDACYVRENIPNSTKLQFSAGVRLF